MVVEVYAIKLVHLALEGVERGVQCCERAETLLRVVVGLERGDKHLCRGVVEQQQIESQPRLDLRGEVVSHVVAAIVHTLRKVGIKCLVINLRDVGKGNRRCRIVCFKI